MKIIKMFALLVTLLLVLTIQAKAQSVTAFDYTGNTEEAINSPGSWYLSGTNYTGELSFTTSVNGQPGQDLFGAREQVFFNQPTNISFLDYTVLSQALGPGTVNFTYSIGGVQSDPISFAITQAETNLGTDLTFTGQVPLDVDLSPGTYWLTEQGSTSEGLYTTSQTYISAVPEPPTVVSFGLGLLVLFWKTLSLRRFLRFKRITK